MAPDDRRQSTSVKSRRPRAAAALETEVESNIAGVLRLNHGAIIIAPWAEPSHTQTDSNCIAADNASEPAARLTKHLMIYHKIILSLLQDRLTIVT